MALDVELERTEVGVDAVRLEVLARVAIKVDNKNDNKNIPL